MNEVDAVITGRHHNPHQVLGAHPRGSDVIFRSLRPGAKQVTVRMSSATLALERRDGDLFEARLSDIDHVPDYTLEVIYDDDTSIVELDPYAFPPTVGDLDLYLVGEGRHEHLVDVLGARHYEFGPVIGTAFSVWAPSAEAVSLVGDFNAWNVISHPMRALGSSGIWELFMPGVDSGTIYKFAILDRGGLRRLKADPMAHAAEVPPRTGSVTWNSKYEWKDNLWRGNLSERQPWREAMSIYEVHLESWRHGLDCNELAEQLGEYVSDLGFTHIELMPIMEHPFGGSWGYQVTGFYAPTSRFGSPDDFRAFVDAMHTRGIGVIFDWVPAHFPRDEWALAKFDGTALYEHEDERRGTHAEWGTLVFNHGRNEVRNFLISSARNWLGEFHGDGLRVDAVASMLYLDYSRRPGEWVPNRFGGREDLEALAFLRELNTDLYREFPGTMTIAEESTAWPGVSRPVSEGGLGFGFKWNMGWMHDTLEYFSHDAIHRRYHHNELTFSLLYAFSENFILPLSHDEVVYGKGSLLAKMPGDRWQQFANLRVLYGYMWAHPGKKLLFMGGEFAQEHEWNHDGQLDWGLLGDERHANIQKLVRDLNHLYRHEPALWELDNDPAGFRWIQPSDADQNVIAFARVGTDDRRQLICVCNLSPVPRDQYRIGVPSSGDWLEILNTDSSFYGGGDIGNGGSVESTPIASNGFENSVVLVLPPLSAVWLVPRSTRFETR